MINTTDNTHTYNLSITDVADAVFNPGSWYLGETTTSFASNGSFTLHFDFTTLPVYYNTTDDQYQIKVKVSLTYIINLCLFCLKLIFEF